MEQKVPKTRSGSLRNAAKREKVSHTTMARAAKFARAINAIGVAAGEGAKQNILNRHPHIRRREVQKLAEIATALPTAARNIVVKIQAENRPQEIKRIIGEAYGHLFPDEATLAEENLKFMTLFSCIKTIALAGSTPEKMVTPEEMVELAAKYHCVPLVALVEQAQLWLQEVAALAATKAALAEDNWLF